MRIAIAALFAAGLATLPLSAAQAQYYAYPPCTAFPLSWPFCIAGAAVSTAATIATAPFYAVAGGHYYHYGQPYYAQPYYGQPYYAQPYYAQPYYAQPYYHSPRRYHKRRPVARAKAATRIGRSNPPAPAQANPQ